MKFFTNKYMDNCKNPVEFQSHWSKVKVTRPYFMFYHCEIGPFC